MNSVSCAICDNDSLIRLAIVPRMPLSRMVDVGVCNAGANAGRGGGAAATGAGDDSDVDGDDSDGDGDDSDGDSEAAFSRART